MTTQPNRGEAMPALIVVDVQRGILEMTPDDVAGRLVTENARLARAFHEAGLPVVWVTATGLPPGRVAQPVPEPEELPEDFSQLHPDLPVEDGDIHQPKPRTWSPFVRTDLAEKLRRRGITDLVIGGTATGGGVESCARSAYDEGFTVTVVEDACADPNPQRHEASMANVFPTLGFVARATSIVEQLIKRG